MEEEKIDKMWSIETKLALGDKLTDEEKRFYNDHLEEMKKEMYENYQVWENAEKIK